MNQNPNISTSIHEVSRSHTNQQRETIDFNKFFFLFLHNWYYFVIALILTISGAYFYVKVVLPTYRVTATLLFDESEQNASITPDNIMQGIGLRPRRQNLENQVQLISSWSMSYKCISELPFAVKYYEINRFNSSDFYPNIPFHVIYESTDSLPYGVEFSIYFIDEKNFHIVAEENENLTFNKKGGYGESLDGGNFKFSIQKDNKYWQPDLINKTLYFKFLSSHDLNKSFRDRLDIVQQGMESTTILLSIEGAEWRKDLDYLSKLIEVFETTNLNKRNHEADRTIQFIDEQLSDITDSLLIAEDKLQEFRSQNRVMDISEQGSQVLEQAIRLEDERARLMIENDYFTYLSEYLSLEETVDQVIAPATMGISDPMVVSLVGQLAELQSEYYSLGAGGKNPVQINLSIRIRNTKRALQETLKGILRSNNYAIEENRTRLGSLNRQAEALPVTERKLLGIEREFKLNDALYNFLLQKQAEAQIQKASTSSNTEIVDPPRVMDIPIWPKKKLIFLVAFLLGVIIPSVIIIISDALNLKIDSEEKIKKFTDIPITGHILHNKKLFQTVVLDEPNSVVSESFRSLRTRLRFFTKETSSPVILLTSSMPGEGKSFTALNLASAYCLEEKKTILVGFDLRRPKLFDDFKLNNNIGVSTYLIGKDPLDDVIQSTDNPYLDLISAGPVPPNPAELAASPKTEQLINELKKKYDYVILDSAPIGSVSDSYSLANLADTNLLLIRNKKSLKKLVQTTLFDLKSTGIRGLGIIYNDLPPRKGYYGYKYVQK